MIGLTFKTPNEYGSVLYQILRSVNVLSYDWMIIADDIIPSRGSNNSGLFCSEVVDGQYFLNSIMREGYYTIFVDVKAFPQGGAPKSILSFDDFINSECLMILLCVDSCYYSFYCKDSGILSTVYGNCSKVGFEKICFIPAEEATNREMVAW